MKKENYCQQLKGFPKNNGDTLRNNLYICKINGQRCIASTYDDPDPGHWASLGEVARYNDDRAQEDCLAYNAGDELAKRLRVHGLERQKSLLEQEASKLEIKINEEK